MWRLFLFAERATIFILLVIIGVSISFFSVGAQEFRTSEVASLYTIADNGVVFGDIISLDTDTGTYRRARSAGDEHMFGVAIQNPVLLYRAGTATGTVPVVGTGEVAVNVTTINGAIRVGDYITSSVIPGKGQKADKSTGFILGIAQEPFGIGSGEATTTPSGETIYIGDVLVKLQIGPHPELKEGATGISETTLLNIIQYIVAGFVTVGSIFIAFRNFGPNLREGVASVGRNPLARASIQSMVVFNAILIILISLGGLFVGVAIILLPI